MTVYPHVAFNCSGKETLQRGKVLLTFLNWLEGLKSKHGCKKINHINRKNKIKILDSYCQQRKKAQKNKNTAFCVACCPNFASYLLWLEIITTWKERFPSWTPAHRKLCFQRKCLSAYLCVYSTSKQSIHHYRGWYHGCSSQSSGTHSSIFQPTPSALAGGDIGTFPSQPADIITPENPQPVSRWKTSEKISPEGVRQTSWLHVQTT